MQNNTSNKLYFKFKFSTMPVSLNNNTVNAPITHLQQTADTAKKAAKPTNTMVDEALIELHTVKGTTLKKVYKYIMENYKIPTITKIREHLIKNHIKELEAAKYLEFKTANGFAGHFKLKDKNKFTIMVEKKLKQAKEDRKVKKSQTNTASKIQKKGVSETTSKVVKRKVKKVPVPTQSEPVILLQTTPPTRRRNQNASSSMFDTPLLPSQVYAASTPLIESQNVPQAPNVNEKNNRKRALHTLSEVDDTPRTSLPGKKRKTHKRGE